MVKRRTKPTFIAKDIRIFFNTVEHAIRTMKNAGILAGAEKKDMGEYMEYTVPNPQEESPGQNNGRQPDRNRRKGCRLHSTSFITFPYSFPVGKAGVSLQEAPAFSICFT